MDNDETICENIHMLMKDTGVVIDTVSSAKMALNLLKENNTDKFAYQLLLIDWNVVDKEGIACVKDIRNCIPKEVPILFLVECDAEGVEEALAIENTKIFTKPSRPLLFIVSIECSSLCSVRNSNIFS